jgi:PncC family amidohydrolase
MLRERSLNLAVAESLTGGMLASYFAGGPRPTGWFQGAIVADASEAKHATLDVGDLPVVSEAAARQMARSAARLFHSDIALRLTGTGGPDRQW